MRINDVIRSKPSHDVVTINPSATVRELLELLSQHNIGAVVVSSDGAQVDGIVSERDVVRRLAKHDDLLTHPVSSIMTSEVFTCEGGHALDDLMQEMTDHRIRHVPVIADGALAGIISIGDVVKTRIGQLEFERDQLDSYLNS